MRKLRLFHICLGISCLIISCSEPTKEIDFTLSQVELESLMSTLNLSFQKNQNIHVFYSEKYNDSTGVLDIYVSPIMAKRDLGVVQLASYKQNNIFVYDSLANPIEVPSELAEKSDASFFWTPDLPSWKILVERRKGDLQLREIRFLNISSQDKMEDDPDIY